MATIGNDNGRKRVLFVSGDSKRRTLRLGKMSQRNAEFIRGHVEDLLTASLSSQPVSRGTAQWLAEIGDRLHDRLARTGLVKPRGTVETTKLGTFIAQYIASRVDLKSGSLAVLKQAQDGLLSYFGSNRAMDTITPGEADAWRLAMLNAGLAEATIRKRTQGAKQFYRAAIRKRLMVENPLADLSSGSRSNPKRLRYIDRATIQKVIDACPDAEWRLIVALARYAGIRIPSELLALRWRDVDWEHSRVTIHASKTEHHEGKDTRVVPLFPEILPHLREVFEQAQPGAEYVITRYRQSNANLRTQFQRIITKAGVVPWPKPFHNLRASRETELVETFPLHVVVQWIGNTAKIAQRHYLQVTDEHFARAVAAPENTPSDVAKQATEKAAQKAAQ